MSTVVLPNTSKSTSDPNLFSDVYDNDNAIATIVNGNLDNSNVSGTAGIALNKLATGTTGQLLVCNAGGTVTAVSMSGDATLAASGALTIGSSKVTNAMLKSPAIGLYRQVANQSGWFPADATAGTYAISTIMKESPYDLDTTSTASQAIPLWRWATTDQVDPGSALTTYMNIRSMVSTNATASTRNFTVGLYPVTVAGAADTLTLTLGTVIAGSTSVHTAPATGNDSATSGDFAVPAAAAYTLGCVLSGTLANNSAIQVSADLRVHNA